MKVNVYDGRNMGFTCFQTFMAQQLLYVTYASAFYILHCATLYLCDPHKSQNKQSYYFFKQN
jgi:hypothetical protein